MAGKVQRWCVSHTVKGTASIYILNGGGGTQTITIPEGVYWSDPVYGTLKTSAAPSLYGQFTYQIDNTALTCSVALQDSVGTYLFKSIKYTESTLAYYPDFGNGNTTDEGRRLAKALGFGGIRLTGEAVMDGSYYGLMEGLWRANQGEYGSNQEQAESNGANMRSFNGYAYGFKVGEPLRRRLIRFSGLPELLTWQAGQVQASNQSLYDFSFESHIWKYLARGEMVRVYDNESATHTYTTEAMTKTTVDVDVASGTGISNNDLIWIDGEQVRVRSGGGTTTLHLQRPNPVAHSAYAPVSTDRVATYVLDNEGGNANMGDFAAERRAYNQTRYDLDVPLLRTNF